jgi:hypothetical protein
MASAGRPWHNDLMLRWTLGVLLVVILLAQRLTQAAGEKAQTAPAAAQIPVEAYESPKDFAQSGNFAFTYPVELVVLQDYVYTDAAVPGDRHIVILRHKDAETGDLRFVEINMLRSLHQRMSCVDYTYCHYADGVVIGTNSEDPEFRKAFEAVVGSFKRR